MQELEDTLLGKHPSMPPVTWKRSPEPVFGAIPCQLESQHPFLLLRAYQRGSELLQSYSATKHLAQTWDIKTSLARIRLFTYR